MAASTPRYEVYAVKYAGPFTSKLAFLVWLEGWDEVISRNYYVWVVRGAGETIVVDTGVNPELAAARRLGGYVNPLQALARIGVDGASVTRVVVTHMHFDHAGGVALFRDACPRAVFYVQRRELAFWTRHPVARRRIFAAFTDPASNEALSDMAASGRLEVVDGDRTIAPGVELLLTPGHTVGLQSLACETARGRAIVASDCAHLARNVRDDRPSSLITDLVAWMESYDKLRARAAADLIFPGHDAALLTDYPRVAEDVTRLA